MRELQFYNLETKSVSLNEIYLSKILKAVRIRAIVLHATARLD